MADDSDLATVVDRFLDSADEAFAEYDQGYADADATVRVLRAHIEDLRDARE